MSDITHHPDYKHVILRGDGRVGLPRAEPITTVKSLAKHIQSALLVELCTIPLYLTGSWSVQGALAQDVTHVAVEEMLHLCLAGNVLRGLKDDNHQFQPILYLKEFVPIYPLDLPGRIPPLPLHLRPLTKDNLQTFVDLELPEEPISRGPDDSDKIEYHTLGEFYLAIWKGIQLLSGQKEIFAPESVPFQFSGGDQIWFGSGEVTPVLNPASALVALTTIVTQGEGNSSDWPPTPNPEKNHYEIFKGWREGTATWEPTQIVTNPSTEGYQDNNIRQLSRTFDAAYCLLLLTLQTLWTKDVPNDRSNLINQNFWPLMTSIIGPLSTFMRSQPVGSEFATPAFNFYDFNVSSSATAQLQSEVDISVKLYTVGGNVPAGLKQVQDAVKNLAEVSVPTPALHSDVAPL